MAEGGMTAAGLDDEIQRVHGRVREVYARAAQASSDGVAACCGPGCGADPGAGLFGAGLYDDLSTVPAGAVAASLGCGNPTAVAELAAGERVLDVGSGGGIDVVLSARRVGPAGFVYGLDLTPEMVALARRNAAEAGVTNVGFIEGTMEAIPLEDAAVDVVISNCVVNLSPDKDAVFAELHRVLRPGGRLGISDVVTDDALTAAAREVRSGLVGCIVGALARSDYEQRLQRAGFVEVSITPTHEIGDGVHGAIVRGRRP